MRLWTGRVALLGVLVLLTAGCDWTMFGYGPAHTHYDPTERTIGVGNVANLTNVWTDVTGGSVVVSVPAVAGGVLYVGSMDGKLYAFDAAGSKGCSGTPRMCAPLWSSPNLGVGVYTSPAVVNGVVYVGSGTQLFAFDAAGSIGCSGTPKICSPLWSSASTNGSVESSPAVTNGVVYMGSYTKLYAYDAAGSIGCWGTPKTCAPLWTAALADITISSPAVANGVVYIGTRDADDGLYAFDAAGSKGCSGTPKTCTPLWTASLGTYSGGGGTDSSPAVVQGVVYIGSDDPAVGLFAFDASGSTGCSGTPKRCTPLWNGANDQYFTSSIRGSTAVANGTVFGAGDNARLYAFDAGGSTGCSGTPKICFPLWFANFGDANSGSDPMVANGIVYDGEGSHLHAYDASGSTGCSGSPKICSPLWTWTTPTGAHVYSPVIANGIVYVGSDTNLYAFKP